MLQNRWVVYNSDRVFLIRVYVDKLGDTSLPAETPEMVDDEFLKSLHHVLLEVRFCGSPVLQCISPRISDAHRRRVYDLPQLWACIPHSEWNT